MCQLLVFTIEVHYIVFVAQHNRVQKSTRITITLFEEFQKCGGYNVLASNLVLLSKLGTKHERVFCLRFPFFVNQNRYN